MGDLTRRRNQQEIIGPQQPWEWHRDTQGRTVGDASLDATGVRQQSPRGQQAEGRMSQVAAIFNPASQPLNKKSQDRLEPARYLSGLLSLLEISCQLRRECRNVGMDKADVVVALTDGGGGLEDCLLDALGGVALETVFVLDFDHASEHVHDFLKEWISDEERRKSIAAQWCHLLKEQGGCAILDRLQELDLSKTSATVREADRLLTGYLQQNQHRTDYSAYLRRGWQIGSGVIESACKSVVGRRLKGLGMRWRERGGHSPVPAPSPVPIRISPLGLLLDQTPHHLMTYFSDAHPRSFPRMIPDGISESAFPARVSLSCW